MAAQTQHKTKRIVACRECQRLKLKCNKSWPCDSCIKRGVEDVCPEGVLPTTKLQRSNLIDTSRLHENNAQMGARIRQLESALAAIQAKISNETHPLLIDDLLPLGTPLELPPVLEGIKAKTKTVALEETLEAFGTLSIGAKGRTTFHSQAVSADYLVEPPFTLRTRDRAIAEAMSLTPEIINLGTLFPFGDTTTPLVDLKHQILSFLPPVEKVCHLAENYFDYVSWWSDPIPRDQFDREVLPLLNTSPEVVSADRLTVLFMILALGTFLEIEGPLDMTSSDSYWQLSRATFCLEPLLDVSTTFTIQALQLMAAYHHITSRQKVEHQWVILGLISRLIHSSGLHFDGEHWIKDIRDKHIVEWRRKIFHEALAYDTLMSFTMGRPPAFALAHVQCKLPADQEKFVTESGAEECGFPTWRYRFTKECLSPIMDDAFGAKPPSYSTILRLDRKLREFPVPSHLIYPGLAGRPEESNPRSISLRTWMQRAFLFCLKETSLMYLHRSHFAQALLDDPEDPLSGRYAASVLATFRSASRVIAGVRDISFRYMVLVSRVWWVWQNLFSAGIALAMVVLRAPKSRLAQPALVELRQAHELLEHRVLECRSEHSRRLMEKLLAVAETTFRTGEPVAISCGSGTFDADELVILTAAPRTVSGEDYEESPTSIYMPQVERSLRPSHACWRDAHPDLKQFFNQAGTQVPSDATSTHSRDLESKLPSSGLSMDLSDPNIFESSGSNESQWEQLLRQLAS